MKKGPLLFVLLIAAACSREKPASNLPAASTTTTVAPAATAPPKPAATYEQAVTWFRTTPGFRFVVEEGGVHAEGEVTRETVGAERVTVTVNGETWSASIGPKGVNWQRGGKDAEAPPWGNRLFQRVTIAFDPQKQEGTAQLVEPNHFRFTDANSGQVHDVWTNDAGQIARMTIGSAVSMTFSGQQ
ncbi:MAG TPA: hypothetical protein VEU30_08455 [Thermoanaerobaculia bacterium]|nr:hypothetical protein [Thermoanaerobaculia bacterium]